MSTPMIYTKHGNVPCDSLTLHVEWAFGEHSDLAGMPRWIKCREYYTDNITGEIVKDGCHIYDSVGVDARAAVASL